MAQPSKPAAPAQERVRRTLSERLAAKQAETAALSARVKLGENPATRPLIQAAMSIERARPLGRKDADTLLDTAKKVLRDLVSLLNKA